MTDAEKIKAYDYTLDVLESTGRTMDRLDKDGALSDFGKGDLLRIRSTIDFLKGYTFEGDGYK
jgi:hypothetical protein